MENVFSSIAIGLLIGFFVGVASVKNYIKYIVRETIDEIDSQDLDDEDGDDDLDPWEKNPDFWKKG